MKRVYTDERFPGYEVCNNGQTLFEVLLNGELVSTFESWDQPSGVITERFASRRAVDFFNRMETTPVPELKMAALDESVERRPTTQEIDRLIAKERFESAPKHQQALRRHIVTLMRQEESLAEAVVNHLIEAL